MNLFGHIGNAGRVQGLTVEFRDLDATSGNGVIARENSGTIERCSVRIYDTLTISGGFGLIANQNAGLIEHCRGAVSKFSASNTTASAAGIALSKLRHDPKLLFCRYVSQGAALCHHVQYVRREGRKLLLQR